MCEQSRDPFISTIDGSCHVICSHMRILVHPLVDQTVTDSQCEAGSHRQRSFCAAQNFCARQRRRTRSERSAQNFDSLKLGGALVTADNKQTGRPRFCWSPTVGRTSNYPPQEWTTFGTITPSSGLVRCATVTKATFSMTPSLSESTNYQRPASPSRVTVGTEEDDSDALEVYAAEDGLELAGKSKATTDSHSWPHWAIVVTLTASLLILLEVLVIFGLLYYYRRPYPSEVKGDTSESVPVKSTVKGETPVKNCPSKSGAIVWPSVPSDASASRSCSNKAAAVVGTSLATKSQHQPPPKGSNLRKASTCLSPPGSDCETTVTRWSMRKLMLESATSGTAPAGQLKSSIKSSIKPVVGSRRKVSRLVSSRRSDSTSGRHVKLPKFGSIVVDAKSAFTLKTGATDRGVAISTVASTLSACTASSALTSAFKSKVNARGQRK